MVREIACIVLALLTDGLYAAVNNLSIRQRALLNESGILPEYFKTFADDVKIRRLNPVNSQVHQIPGDISKTQKRRGRPPKKKMDDEIIPVPKRKLGKPKGSKSQKTLEKETLSKKHPQPEKRGPGRTKRSKNKLKTASVKRGRDRPGKNNS